MTSDLPTATAVAQIILDGFNLHYWLFREYALKAREHFERREWEEQWETSRARIDMYDQRVAETVATADEAMLRLGDIICLMKVHASKTLEAVADVLRAAGCEVVIPPRRLCCGSLSPKPPRFLRSSCAGTYI